MKEFNELCADFERMNPVEYGTYLSVKSAEIIPLLNKVTVDNISGMEVFYSFILGAIVADGKFELEEYLLVAPLLNRIVGQIVTYKQATELFLLYKKDYKALLKTVDRMIDLLGSISEDLKDDIIIICMMVCAVDGKINSREKKWIMQLIK